MSFGFRFLRHVQMLPKVQQMPQHFQVPSLPGLFKLSNLCFLPGLIPLYFFGEDPFCPSNHLALLTSELTSKLISSRGTLTI